MVVATGWPQIADTILVLVSTCGIAFAMFGRYFENAAADSALRILLAIVAGVTMFHPNDTLVWGPAAIVFGMLLFGLWRHRLVASPMPGTTVAEMEEPAAVRQDAELAALAAEAKREV
jgi:hypothetical protein